ncbi:Kiwa anti-phage protein KwaB-like domain-containing protein [Chitinibacter sp. S2-10]|uniref:Kiwa anti-phage protein KwaB-like domain-containing protein n=1 Tax=Chitinibacter sp. S2-10 TaxID=3373597 RepID=UPI0039777E2E
MLELLNELKNEVYDEATVSMWVVKRSAKVGKSYVANSVRLSPDLADRFLNVASDGMDLIIEEEDYTTLAQVNDNSVLSISTVETSFPILIDEINQPPEEHWIENSKDLMRSVCFVIKIEFVSGNVLFCVKKSGVDWSATKRSKFIPTMFANETLVVNEEPIFHIGNNFDFYAYKEGIFIRSKEKFESVLQFKASYADDFGEMTSEPEFVNVFSNFAELQQYVGTNTIQLRRMSAIRQKGFYKDRNFMERLKAINERDGWGIEFDQNDKINITKEKVRDIIQVLLDHRLYSELSLAKYDVPNAVKL